MKTLNKTTAQLKYSFMLFIASFIWGTTFVAQSVAMDYLQPFTFNAIRSLLGGVVLIPLIISKNKKTVCLNRNIQSNKKVIRGGILCGLCLFVASNLQQVGLLTTSAGKAGFITSLYIVIVPILGLFFKRKTSAFVWFAVAVSLVGMYLLCITVNFSIQFGDILILLCAIVFSLHILIIDYYSPFVDSIKMSCIQFFVCGCLSIILMLLFEQPNFEDILNCWGPILYCGVLSCGVAYTLQIVGQKRVSPTIACLIMSLEAVVSVLASWIILHEVLSLKEMIGCLLVFIAVIFAGIPRKP